MIPCLCCLRLARNCDVIIRKRPQCFVRPSETNIYYYVRHICLENITTTSTWFLAHLSLKSQVSFSDHLSFVCPPGCLSVSKLFTYIFFSGTTGPISTKLGTKHPWVKRFQVCSNDNFNQIWHIVFLVEGDSSLFKFITILYS